MNRDTRRTAKLYERFREEVVSSARPVRVNVPKSVAVMGHAEFVGYMTTHGGETFLYVHAFAPGSRPLICAGTRQNQLYFVGGRYKVTAHGITDIDTRGRLILGHRRRPRYELRQLGSTRRTKF